MSKEEVLSYFYTNSTNYGIKSTFVIPLCSGGFGHPPTTATASSDGKATLYRKTKEWTKP